MHIRPPPLNAIRAFTVAARHLSFTLAAHELHVTHSAISRQIKLLEAHLGVALFERQIRQVHLTPAGHKFYAQVEPALAQIGEAAQSLCAAAQKRVVRINVRPTFALRWLIPRLHGFVTQHPGIEPQVITSTLMPSQVAGEFDIAIRRSTQGWPSAMPMQPFLEDEVLLVGSPALFAKRPAKNLKALASHVFLESTSRRNDWSNWTKQINMPQLKPKSSLQFEHLHFVLQAAIDGLGVALAPTSLIAHDMAAGRLVCPFPEHRMALNRYYYCHASNTSAETKLLVQWLLEEMEAERNAKR